MASQLLSPDMPPRVDKSQTPSPPPQLNLSSLRRKRSRTIVACLRCRASKIKCDRPNPDSLDPCGQCIKFANRNQQGTDCRYLTIAQEEEEKRRSQGEISPGLTDSSGSSLSSALPTTPLSPEKEPWFSPHGVPGAWIDTSSVSSQTPQAMMPWSSGETTYQGSLQHQTDYGHGMVPFQWWESGNAQTSNTFQGPWNSRQHGFTSFPANPTTPFLQNVQGDMGVARSAPSIIPPSGLISQGPANNTMGGGIYHQNYVHPSAIATPNPNPVLVDQTISHPNSWPQSYPAQSEAHLRYSEKGDYENEQLWP